MRRALVLWLVLFGLYAATLPLDSGRGERYTTSEARVLLIARSIVRDGDVDLRNQYREGQWRSLRHARLHPVATRLTEGRLLEPIGVGLPALIAPAYALGGPRAVELFLAAVLALAVVLGAALAGRLIGEPWATGTAVVLGLSPPMLAAATTVAPEGAVAALLAGAALFALRLREDPRAVWAVWCALLISLLPWIGLRFLLPGVVIAVLMARWLRRRRRGLAGFVALELILLSALLYLTIHDRLYRGASPDAVLPPGMTGTGAHGLAEHADRVTRVLGLWLDPDAGLLWWAPGTALFFVGVWRLWHSRHARLWKIAPEQVDVDVTAGMCLAVVVGGLLAAVFTVPALHSLWFAGHDLVPVFAFGAALAAWGAQRVPRMAAGLLALTVVASLWFLAAALLGHGVALHPAHGPLLPWGGATGALPSWPSG